MLLGKINVREYGKHNDPLGYIEPEGPEPPWIMWLYQDGHAELYTKRSYENGNRGAVEGQPIFLPLTKEQEPSHDPTRPQGA